MSHAWCLLRLIEDHKHSEQQRYTSTRQNYEYETN